MADDDNSANLALPYLAPAQAQKHVTVNEALRVLDAVTQLAVLSRGTAAPPEAPAPGARYIVPAGATGAWAGQADTVAVAEDGGWRFLAPRPGWRAEVLDEGLAAIWRDGAWVASGGGGSGGGGGALPESVARLGVNATPDATNRLAVAAAATLLTHDGAGHRLKIDKAAAGETASLLFQTGFSGRAEMGLAGSDDFAVKVSADGADWVTALSVEAATGRVSGAAVQAAPGDTGAGRLARADWVFGPGNLLGPVALAGGAPAGAVLERGETADGAYLRLACGTQLCWAARVSEAGGPAVWTFPAPFAAGTAQVQASVQEDMAAFASAAAPDATGTSFSAWTPAGARAAATCALLAVGRWA